MHSGLLKLAGALACTAGLTACEMPRHSNTLLFGTNTNLGINVGTDASKTPNVSIGYQRQEAVIMPLVANDKEDANGKLVPCTIGPNVAGNAEWQHDSCVLIGERSGKDVHAVDAYSVFASFGSTFNADSSTGKAGGSVAQFFATGIAAQALAVAGAPTVAVGDAAEEAGKTGNNAVAALFSDKVSVQQGIDQAAQIPPLVNQISGIVKTLTPEQLPGALAALKKGIGPDGVLVDQACPKEPALAPAACAANLEDQLRSVSPPALQSGLDALKEATKKG